MLKRVVVGDFRVNFGQGLAFGTSLLSGKGGGADGLRRFADGLRPVAITNEGNVFRGAGFTIGNSKSTARCMPATSRTAKTPDLACL